LVKGSLIEATRELHNVSLNGSWLHPLSLVLGSVKTARLTVSAAS
jgi:hypothetical protein